MNACPDLLAALHQRRRDLEMDLAAVRARLAEVQEMLDLIEQPQRRRRRKPDPAEISDPPLSMPNTRPRGVQPSSADELFPDPQDTQESAQ